MHAGCHVKLDGIASASAFQKAGPCAMTASTSASPRPGNGREAQPGRPCLPKPCACRELDSCVMSACRGRDGPSPDFGSSRPPHTPQRAALPHRAPTSGPGIEWKAVLSRPRRCPASSSPGPSPLPPAPGHRSGRRLLLRGGGGAKMGGLELKAYLKPRLCQTSAARPSGCRMRAARGFDVR